MKSRWLLLILELLLLAMFAAAYPEIDAGSVAGMAFALLLAAVTVFFEPLKRLWQRRAGKVLIVLFAGIMAIDLLFDAVLSALMINAMRRTPESPGALMVLGYRVEDDKPSEMLIRRLDAALEAMEKYPEIPVILTGGQGSGEGLPEAEHMRRYLADKGADMSRVIIEDRSSSTEENMRFSFLLTDERNIAVITDGYHQFRASVFAKREGAEKVSAVCADTEPRKLPSCWVREWIAVKYMLVTSVLS